MGNNRTLRDLKESERAWVRALLISGGLRRRLRDLGLVEGAEVECVGKSPGGDPAAYLICGAVIALRAEDSGRIRIREKGPAEEEAMWT